MTYPGITGSESLPDFDGQGVVDGGPVHFLYVHVENPVYARAVDLLQVDVDYPGRRACLIRFEERVEEYAPERERYEGENYLRVGVYLHVMPPWGDSLTRDGEVACLLSPKCYNMVTRGR